MMLLPKYLTWVQDEGAHLNTHSKQIWAMVMFKKHTVSLASVILAVLSLIYQVQL